MCPKRVLVDLDVVAVSLLHGLGKLGPNDAVLLGNRAEALGHAALHTLQAAHVDMRLFVLHHLPEFFWVLLLVGLMLVVIQQGLGIWHTSVITCELY